jgi:hypothetical protein
MSGRSRLKRAMIVWLLGLCVLVLCGLPTLAQAKPSEHQFELVPGSFRFAPSSLQAGAHADWVTSFAFEPEGETNETYNDARNIAVELPTGFNASNTAVPTCTQAQLLAQNPRSTVTGLLANCPLSSQVGTIDLELTGSGGRSWQVTTPVYNMEVTSFGTAAQLGYRTVFFTGLLQIGVRQQDLGLSSATTNIPKVGEVHKVTVTIWAVPASKEHDALRGAVCGGHGEIPPVCENEYGSPQPANIAVRPFLSNPTSCGMFEAKMEADSWEEPFNWTKATDMVGPIAECERVPFEPSIEAQPSTRAAESPTGLEVTQVVPQTWENPFSIATSNLKDTTVTLPEGMTANPGLAEGLGACDPAQYARETSSSLPGEGCPPESKIGSILIETPLLGESIPGAVYLATPYDNPFGEAEHPGGSLLALYIVAKDPARGLLIKVAGKITPNPVTGQLTTTFDDTPQQPFSKFILKFRPGATAPLISPPTCGAYTVQGQMTPWSAPEEPRPVVSQPFQITQGVHEGACPAGGVPPFKPQVVSGTQNNAGGNYSPFYLRILREDGEQELIKFSTTLPPGLTGNLTGIPFCSDAAIEASKIVTGAEEEAHPSCPAASEIGHTLVEAGVGSVLAQNPGKIYLAGPYKGAPLSIVSITSAKVGPFDLGTVVIRFALDINPITAQVEVSGAQSDPIPHIIRGIVIHVRDIRVYMDRHDFTLNPTDCSQKNITDAIVGSGSNYANPANQDTVSVQTPFEVADCASLAFKPSFKASTSGKTSRTKGASLSVKLIVAGALGTQSNIRSVKVALPKQLPSRLTTLQKACVDTTFDANPAACPADSRVGHATALTPILPVPLEGPAYFVSHGGAKFPELIVVLQGYGFTIDLHGETFISKTGITSSTFHTIPDQPVTSFELTLPQGPDSALAAPGSLCAVTKTVLAKRKMTVRVKGHKKTVTRKVRTTLPASLIMPTAFTAQNGMVIKQSTPITVTGCGKAAKKAKTSKRVGHRGGMGRKG